MATAPPAVEPAPTSAAPAPPPSSPAETRAARYRGNASLWLIALSVVLFKLWRVHSGLPEAAQVRPLSGVLPFSVRQLAGFYNFLMGWLGLAALVSLSDLGRVFIHFFQPLSLIRDSELRKVLMAPAMFGFAVLVFAFTLLVWRSVWVVQLNSEYEVIARLEAGSRARFVAADGADLRTLRLSSSAPGRLVLGGPRTTATLRVRDKYGLRTLDAFVLRRTPLGYQLLPCAERRAGSVVLPPGEPAGEGVRPDGPRELRIYGPLRWSGERVRTPLELRDGGMSQGGWLRAGDGKDGPERGAPRWAATYLERLFAERDSLARWEELPNYGGEVPPTVSAAIRGYELTVAYEDVSFTCPGAARFRSREALVLSARETAD